MRSAKLRNVPFQGFAISPFGLLHEEVVYFGPITPIREVLLRADRRDNRREMPAWR